MSDTIDVDKLEKMLEEFNELDTPPERHDSFMEIMGIAHKEDINSKILKFFFDTNEAHGLQDLFLQALYKCFNEDRTDNIIKSQSIDTETTTKNAKNNKARIDIFIKTNDDLLIIENKIHHHAKNNDFNSYIEHAENYVREHELNIEPTYVMLALKDDEARHEKFDFVSHFELVKHVKEILGNYLIHANNYYVSFLLDYIHSIENLNEESEIGRMEKSMVEFFGNNYEQLNKLVEAQEYFIDYSNQTIETVKELLQKQSSNFFKHEYKLDTFPWVGYSLYSDDIFEHSSVLKHGIQYYFDLSVFSNGVCLAINFRKKIKGNEISKDYFNLLKAVLKDLDIDFDKKSAKEFDEDAEFVNIKKLEWNSKPETIVAEMLPIIQKIESALNLEKDA